MTGLASPTAFFLSLAALVFPFSVAVTNIALGICLVLSILSGLWWQGAKHCWEHNRLLSIAFCFYFALMFLGLAWSLDRVWGLQILGRQWFWLLIPGIAAVGANEVWRKIFLLAMSAGLAANLVYCVLQMFGYVDPGAIGSFKNDATGHIGHIGFGLVYGIWAAWLLHLGLSWKGKRRWIVWGMAIWSYVMIFSAQGRSGYLVAVILMASVVVKWLIHSRNWRSALPAIAMLSVIAIVIVLGPGRDRLEGTWLAFTQSNHANVMRQRNSIVYAEIPAQQRLYMWKTSLDIYRENPVLGVGTGGLPKAVAKLKAEGRLTSRFSFIFVHPHNQYVLDLVRWGPIGLLSLLALLFCWMREGWGRDWWTTSLPPLIFLPSLGLAVHALSSSSLEEHFTSMLAALLLGAGLSVRRH